MSAGGGRPDLDLGMAALLSAYAAVYSESLLKCAIFEHKTVI